MFKLYSLSKRASVSLYLCSQGRISYLMCSSNVAFSNISWRPGRPCITRVWDNLNPIILNYSSLVILVNNLLVLPPILGNGRICQRAILPERPKQNWVNRKRKKDQENHCFLRTQMWKERSAIRILLRMVTGPIVK